MRVGAVNYLNSKPLIEDLGRFAPSVELSLDLPSRLADQMHRGELEIGLIPVIEYFRGDRYTFVPGIAIASRGPVLSVTLFSRVPMESIRTLALDVGSRTSAALVQVLLAKRFNLKPILRTLPIDSPVDDISADAALLIGDRAMKACLPGFPHAWDLGEEWSKFTGLPMVYALWAVRHGVQLNDETVAGFQQAKRHGLANVGRIAEREAPLLGLDAGYCRRYLSHIIRYDLGPDEIAGMNRFRELTLELGLLKSEK
jgi:chorismate dehydratase